MAFKIKPVDSISIGSMCTIEVQSVQIGCVTVLVPPRTLEDLGAVVTTSIIIIIFRSKLHITEKKITNEVNFVVCVLGKLSNHITSGARWEQFK